MRSSKAVNPYTLYNIEGCPGVASAGGTISVYNVLRNYYVVYNVLQSHHSVYSVSGKDYICIPSRWMMIGFLPRMIPGAAEPIFIFEFAFHFSICILHLHLSHSQDCICNFSFADLHL